MESQSQLFEIADRQQGFFTAKQAEECGYAMELQFASARATKDIDLTCLHRVNASDVAIENIQVSFLTNP